MFGAMIPCSMSNSDALFNLGMALSAAQTKECGVYIAMNGQVFDFNKVEKNKELGIFIFWDTVGHPQKPKPQKPAFFSKINL